MSSKCGIFDIMASDIGVRRFLREDDDSFVRRVVYTASRFNIAAYCLDDGADGDEGISKQAINRRLTKWISHLDGFRPGLGEWFDAEGNGIKAIYSRLIDINEIAPCGFNNTFVATQPEVFPISEGCSLLLGFYDITSSDCPIEGLDNDAMVLSGLATLVMHEDEVRAVDRPLPWWLTDIDYMEWAKASDYEHVEFVDAGTSKWSVRQDDAWAEHPLDTGDLTLARIKEDYFKAEYFVARKVRGTMRLSPVSRIQAQELFFFLRSVCDNGAVVTYEQLDNMHARALLPIGLIPGHLNRILNAISWPIDNAATSFDRILRSESIPAVREILAACHIGLREVSNGRRSRG